MSCPFDHSKLEPEAYSEERYLLFTGPLDREHHTFRTAVTESTGYENTTESEERSYLCRIDIEWNAPSRDNGFPSVVVFCRIGHLCFWFEF